MSNKSIYWIFVITVIAVLTVPALVQDGMFLDGVTYSAVSKNMANGYGGPFAPHYTKTLYPEFYEQPPLALIIQAGFFRLFGNGFYTERIFCVFVLALTIVGISRCWRELTTTDMRKFEWLPVVLWICVPLVSWALKNNLLENTMGLFCIFAVWFILKSFNEQRPIYLFAGSIFIFLSFLSKGFSGLFPITVPLIYSIVYGVRKNAILYQLYLILFTVFIAFSTFYIIPGLRKNINLYINQQFIPALTNKREVTVDNRFEIILELLAQLSLPLVVLIYLCARQWKKGSVLNVFKSKAGIIYFLIGMSASLPLILSLKQRQYYLVPSMPFFILAISIFIIPFLKALLDNLSPGIVLWIKRLSLVTCSLLIIFSINRFGDFSRDEEQLSDIYTISRALPPGTVLGTKKELSYDWLLVAYMSRIGYLNLDNTNQHHKYLLFDRGVIDDDITENYKPLDLKLKRYVVLEKRAKPPSEQTGMKVIVNF